MGKIPGEICQIIKIVTTSSNMFILRPYSTRVQMTESGLHQDSAAISCIKRFRARIFHCRTLRRWTVCRKKKCQFRLDQANGKMLEPRDSTEADMSKPQSDVVLHFNDVLCVNFCHDLSLFKTHGAEKSSLLLWDVLKKILDPKMKSPSDGALLELKKRGEPVTFVNL